MKILNPDALDEDLRRKFLKFDLDKSSSLNFDEFVAQIEDEKRRKAEAEAANADPIKAIFNSGDMDFIKGQLSLEEFAALEPGLTPE